MATLLPFGPGPAVDPFCLEGWVGRQGEALRIRYRLRGPLEQLVLGEPSADPQRRDGLWQSTCFEAFLGVEGERQYWELNLSCSGDWNLYRFEGYRSGGGEEPWIQALPIALQRSATQLDLELSLPWGGWLTTVDPRLELSLTAVLEHRQMGCQYWALRHCAAEPDFHQRSSFIAVEQLHSGPVPEGNQAEITGER